MRKSRYSDEHIAAALRQAEIGTPVADITRKLGISEATFYVWKKRFGSLGTPEIRELRQLREENSKLKQVVADVSLDRAVLQDVLKKSGKPGAPKNGSPASAPNVVDVVLRARIKELAITRIRYGQRRIHVLLRREGWTVNVKRAARIYREEGLSLRTKTPRRRRSAIVREQRVECTAPNQSWAMDFMHDVLASGTKIRLLTIVDIFSRESLALEVAYGFKSPQVVDALPGIVAQRGAPQRIHCDNGPEFISLHLDQWAHWTNVKLDFSRPGRPSDNAFCESFNNRVRQELLNPNWFVTLEDAGAQAAAWRHDYNTNHPHSSLGDLSPEEFARRCAKNTLHAAISGVPAD